MNSMSGGGQMRERRNQLIESELGTLFDLSRLLSRSIDPKGSLPDVLDLLHDHQDIGSGLIGLMDEEDGKIKIAAMHEVGARKMASVTYASGEGIIGRIFQESEPVIVPRIADEPDFLGKTGVYDPALPFIGVPILTEQTGPIGVLAAQPPAGNELLGERARFLEMVSALIAQALRLYSSVQQERRQLEDERDHLRRAVKDQHGFDRMAGGRTKAMRMVFDQVRMVSKWPTTVLIRGESGTGKELVANAIHYNSPRAPGTFIKLNCAALPDQLLESELFGHEKGAFTGANALRKGRFELADGGTLFLDEIGEISAAFQAKLLRVLQEGEFERLGGTKTLTTDVRIITATNRDLESMVEQGEFRQDLYYRLNVMPIVMPPLRDRMEDLPDLAEALVNRIGEKQGRPLSLSDGAVRSMLRHSWPGNVRELENCLERASIMAPEGRIDADMITMTGLTTGRPDCAPASVSVPSSPPPSRPTGMCGPAPADPNDPSLDERERVIAALEQAGWVQAKAARLLNMTPRQIAYRIQTLKIQVKQI